MIVELLLIMTCQIFIVVDYIVLCCIQSNIRDESVNV